MGATVVVKVLYLDKDNGLPNLFYAYIKEICFSSVSQNEDQSECVDVRWIKQPFYILSVWFFGLQKKMFSTVS